MRPPPNLGYPLVLKPRALNASMGVVHVSSRYALITAAADARERCMADLDDAAAAVLLDVLRPLTP